MLVPLPKPNLDPNIVTGEDISRMLDEMARLQDEVKRLRRYIVRERCTCVYAGDGETFVCARCAVLGVGK